MEMETENLLARLIEPKQKLQKERQLFSNVDLKALIAPLFMEQLLVVLVGVADTFMVSHAGEAAISGVSLVNMLNTVFILLFSALAGGGAVVISQYIGRGGRKLGNLACGQLILTAFFFAAVCAVLIHAFQVPVLESIFGKVDTDVMAACRTYLTISSYSYPAIALSEAGMAVYRSMGKTKVTMYISILANGINIIGNGIGIFVLHAGVAGVAWPSLIARTFSAVIMLILCFRKGNMVCLQMKNLLCVNRQMLARILRIALPTGVQNGLFQFSKVAIGSIVALFGTEQIAANGVAQSFWSVAALACSSLSLAFTTVIGRCMGAQDEDAAQYYIKKLLRITFLVSVVWNGAILLVVPIVMKGYALSEGTARLVILLVLIHNVCNAGIFPLASALPSGLQAAGDVKFNLYVSIFTTLVVRMLSSVLLAICMNLGVLGVAAAMCLDWLVHAGIAWRRFKGGKWKEYSVI